MHLNVRSTLVLLLLAFGVGTVGCVDSTEPTDGLATIPQEIVLFSAKSGIDDTALSFGLSKTDGWQLLRYADLQTATDLNEVFQTREQEMNFSGSAAPRGKFSGSLAGSTTKRGQNYSSSFSGETQGMRNFYAKIAGGAAGSCAVHLVCDFLEAICDGIAGAAGASIGECRSSVSQCRQAISEGMGQLTPKEEAAFCAIFDTALSGAGFSFDD